MILFYAQEVMFVIKSLTSTAKRALSNEQLVRVLQLFYALCFYMWNLGEPII